MAISHESRGSPNSLTCQVESALIQLADFLDRLAGGALLPIAAWIFVSGVDDLIVLLAFLRHYAVAPPSPPWRQVIQAPARRIAVFVPCWREAAVIGDMVTHNRSAIRYRNYDVFIGAYPNDEATVAAGRELESRFDNVHLSRCPHDGPTSKADCLNWIFQRMLLFEEESDVRFDIVLTHDAEDLIHPDELHWINYHSAEFDMVQVPVLPLPTPFRNFTHGLYCDDFAEGHTRDLVARVAMGGFLPSCGVGTGYTRWALEQLAASQSNRIFEPACLTEDYENGLRLKKLGLRQTFVPIQFREGVPMATREYFPRRFGQAVRQRTRWVTGIALQTWKRYGWRGAGRQAYWFWRDRKGLLGNPVSLGANLILVYALATWLLSRGGPEWGLGATLAHPLLWRLMAVNVVFQVIHLTVRAACVARVYGWIFALGVPLRVVYGNWLNSVATTRAVFTFLRAEIRREPLVWVKTDHAYPCRAALLPHKRPLAEILAGSGYLTTDQLAHALSTMPPGGELAEHLVRTGLLGEQEVYEAISLQLGLALGRIEPAEVHRNVARALPAAVIERWNVFPYRIEAGSLHLASPDLPSDELHEELRRLTRLDIRVELVTPSNFRVLSEELL